MKTSSIAKLPHQERRAVVGDALALAMGVRTGGFSHPLAQDLAHTPTIQMIGEALGIGPTAGPPIHATLTSSDFDIVLQHAVQRLVADTSAASVEHRKVCKLLDLPNFRPADIARASGGDLAEMGELHQIPHVPVTVQGEVAQLVTYAAKDSLSREAIMNANWGHVAAVTRELLAGGFRRERTAVIDLLNANGDLSDGTAWFHSSRGNTLDAAATLDASQFAALVSALRALRTPRGDYLSLPPAVLLVPASEEVTAHELVHTAGMTLTIIADHRLTARYLLPDPEQWPVIAVAHLRGSRKPDVVPVKWMGTSDYLIRATFDLAAVSVSPYGIRMPLAS